MLRLTRSLQSRSKVVATWFGARPVDLHRFERTLRAHKVPVAVFSPHLASPVATTTTSSTGSTTTTPSGAVGTTSSSAAGDSAVAAAMPSAPTRAQEALVFSVSQDSPKEAIALLQLTPGEKEKTFVLFTDGAMVGWRATWPELVQVWSTAAEGGATLDGPAAASASGVTAILGGFGNSASSPQQSSSTSPTAKLTSPRAPSETVDFRVISNEEVEDNAGEPYCFIDNTTDSFVLAEDDAKSKLPFSFALAQSIKVDAALYSISPISTAVRDWRRELSRKGTLSCTIKQLRRTKTQLLSLSEDVRSKVVVHSSPKIFWLKELQQYRGAYKDACVFLEVEERLGHLQANVDTIDEALTYLHDEMHASSGEYLTRIVILLIFLEIVVVLEGHRIVVQLLADGVRGIVGLATGTAPAAAVMSPTTAVSHK